MAAKGYGRSKSTIKKPSREREKGERNMDKAKLGEILMMFVQTICLLRILKKLDKR